MMKKLVYSIFLFLLFLHNNICFAQSFETNSPSAYNTFGTGAPWSNLSGVQFTDNNPAYVDLAEYPTCNSFMCYRSNVSSYSGLGFNIPVSAVLTGIQVNILQRVSSPGGGIHDSVLTLALNGSAIGINHAIANNWFDTPTMQTYGNSNDLWGTTLSAADINNSTFGLLYQITNTSYDQTASVDSLSVTVFYTVGTSIFSQTSTPFFVEFINDQLVVKAQFQRFQNVSMSIINGNGQVLYRKRFSEQLQLNEEISAQNWAPGIYFVRIEEREATLLRKKLILVK